MIRIYCIILLSIIWLGFSNRISVINILLAIIVASIINYIFLPKKKLQGYTLRILPLLQLIVFVIFELLVSSLLLSRIILSRQAKTASKFIEIDVTDTSNLTKTILASIISLTPGTLFIQFDHEENRLMIHSMLEENPQKVITFIKERLEPKISGVFDK